MEARSVWLPKRGHSLDEYEDAGAADPALGRFAIADGATESSFAGPWARLLADGFVSAAGPQPGRWSDWLPALQQRWLEQFRDKELAWYAEAKLEDGAFATFLGLTLCAPTGFFMERRKWHAVAVGDGCLFQVRDNELYRPFPIERAEDFGNTPWLIGSRNDSSKSLRQKELRAKGDWRTGDCFWLMTDALAQWFLTDIEACGTPWTKLEAVLGSDDSQERFADWVEDQRDRQALKNDDVTLIVVNV
ncbi:MAG: hypothetical protein FJ271_01820 [Planctomycetes bacterium]|nr:hypothetical protein [Planctomycetota bacterium]